MNTIVINNVEIKYPKVGCDMQHILNILGEEKTITFAKNMQVKLLESLECFLKKSFTVEITTFLILGQAGVLLCWG